MIGQKCNAAVGHLGYVTDTRANFDLLNVHDAPLVKADAIKGLSYQGGN